MPNKTEHIRALDLCRGLAALAVLFYHIDFLFFNEPTIIQRGYLCVDFFFLLSGFVVANSYERKLRDGLSLYDFCVIRIARLWPLVALTTLLALAVQLPRWLRDHGGIDAVSVTVTFLCNVLALPSPMSPTDILFPLNGAAWSIFFEVVVNIAYALLLPVLSPSSLVLLVAASGAVMIFAAATLNTLDVGWGAANFVFGFPRVAFSFFLGVCICRLEQNRPLGTQPHPWLLPAGLLVALALISVQRPWLYNVSGLYDLVIAAVLFPALLVIATRTRFQSWGNSAAWLLGGISYSVYLLQTPLVIGFSGLPQALFGTKIGAYIPWAGFIFALLCLPIAYATWVCFEQPMQRWIRAALLPPPEPARQHASEAVGK